MKLSELGERQIIEYIMRPRYESQGVESFGDDCSIVKLNGQDGENTVVITTDPCPKPMATYVGYEDLYYWGWLLATINLSDIAAAGARPLGILTSYILPNETTVDDFKRLLDGVDDCCRFCDTQVIGGNLKEGKSIGLSATAIGICEGRPPGSRTGCEKGDLIVVVGDLGAFWAGVLALKNDIEVEGSDSLLANVLKPLPKVAIGKALAENGIFNASIDNSDGLYPSLIQLADTNGLRMSINMDGIAFSPAVLKVASLLGIEPVRFACGWGDWQLIGCIDPKREQQLYEIAESYKTPVYTIGTVEPGNGVLLEFNGKIGKMAPIDSQRFTDDSWFTSGIDPYINSLIKGPLII